MNNQIRKWILKGVIYLLGWGGTSLWAQQSLYYQQEKIIMLPSEDVLPGKHHEAGMFMVFTSYGCYDADRQGYDVGNGFRQLTSHGKNILKYIGDSYWGNGTVYKVTKDKRRMNITYNNRVFVYVRSTPPIGAMTCRLIRKTSTASTGDITVTPTPYTPIVTSESQSANKEYYLRRYQQLEQSLRADIQTYETTLSSSYTSDKSTMIRSIRLAQNNLKAWRNTASQQGVVIPKSPWEDVQLQEGIVHY